MNREKGESLYLPNEGPEFTGQDFALALENYLGDESKNTVLRPEQIDIFEATRQFFADNEKRGYIVSPTGTGKTVIFVELTKAILELGNEHARTPNILIVTPKKSLVSQTVGENKEKGFKKFAPDLPIGTYYSDSTKTEKDNIDQFNIVVTTYESFRKMTRQQEFRTLNSAEKNEKLEELVRDTITKNGVMFTDVRAELEYINAAIRSAKKASTGRNMLDRYDLFILDEGHHVLREKNAAAVDSLPANVPILTFTATPDASEKKQLKQHFPRKIYEFGVKEAMERERLAPLVVAGVRSDAAIEGSDLYSKDGEYLEERLGYLARMGTRNRAIVDTVKSLTEKGIGTIISCIQGDEALHARLLADYLIREGVAAAAVHGKLPKGQREDIFKDFEEGRLDALTYIDILGEGWDSERAKAIVNGRPTRSQIIARQRLGRILRPGNVAIAIDIIDDYDKYNPPIHIADLLDGEAVPTGFEYGKISPEQRKLSDDVIGQLEKRVLMTPEVRADYSSLLYTISQYPSISKSGGNLESSVKGHYSISDKVSKAYLGVTDQILNFLWGQQGTDPDIIVGHLGYTIRNTYNSKVSTELLHAVPQCETRRAYVEDETRWMSPQGFKIGFSKKYPNTDPQTIQILLEELGNQVEWRPLKEIASSGMGGSLRFNVYKAYRADESTINMLSNKLEEYYTIFKQ